MPLKIYNTLSQWKELFEPLVPGEVRMYACGPTVYDRAHIGHARAALIFDVIWRYLEYRGYRVRYVRNYTDVDDKIINRAAELGQTWESVAEEQIKMYRQDMRALGLRTATMEPRASQHILEMIDIIQTLLRKGIAYSLDGDVYFEVRRCAEYGKLSHRSLEELQAGARIEVDQRKRDPLDFALWKSSKPGEPSWDSPWGPGRPGWHIECSAMSMKYLSETFDIHGGGADLIFPHHENEIAQSECATGKPFARYWIHNGFVNIHAEKMSKSLGNVLTVGELLSHVSPDALKLFLLGTHYRAPLDFSEDAISGAARAEERVRNALAEIQHFEEVRVFDGSSSRADCPLSRQIDETEKEFAAAMDDDFNTPRALAAMFNLVRDVNIALRDAERGSGKALIDALRLAGETLQRQGSVLGGLMQGSPFTVSFRLPIGWSVRVSEEDYRTSREAVELAVTSGEPLPREALKIIVEYRRMRREEQDWAAADAIRAWLADRGVIVDDTAKGARWRLKS